ncbi:membrane-associated protein, putative [Bodo saltans]|uniref:Membrane-associated protein, putative n=1 Tax=Bodo saltans TaxID=75058 RepID=A0A0S4KIX2_BODSA|nr:membrane-associated protein, putative [Bodo saltans]|eukprot:CUI14916.1 membrane-associated protein, putative [Bodo saltans]
MPEPPPFNRLLNFTDLNDDERVHISVSIGLSGFSFLVALMPIYIYLCHRERSLIWSHYNNLIIGCILMQLLQTAARITASIMLLTETMDSTKCKGFSALDASFDTSCLVLLLGFYYSLMAVRWIWSHYNNLIIGCILMQLLQTAARITASIMLLTETMDSTKCKGFSALDASFA